MLFHDAPPEAEKKGCEALRLGIKIVPGMVANNGLKSGRVSILTAAGVFIRWSDDCSPHRNIKLPDAWPDLRDQITQLLMVAQMVDQGLGVFISKEICRVRLSTISIQGTDLVDTCLRALNYEKATS